MFFADAGLEFGIMEQEVGELSALLDEVEAGHAGSFALEFSRRNADEFGEDVAGVVEGQRLVKVAGENVFLAGCVTHVLIR